MFWKLGFHNQKAPLDALLEREDVRLEDVLDQDDVIQEAKAGNNRLISFLSQPESVRKLLRFITEVVNGDEADDKRRFRFPYLACELLVLDIPLIDAAVAESREHLKLLFDFLVQPAPLPPSLSLYFVRVLQTLYNKKPIEVVHYMVGQDYGFALSFIRHVETFGMNELILTLLGTMEEESRLQDGHCVADWWMSHNFIPELFQRLTPQYPADVHINIMRMLCELVRRFNNPNIAHLADCLMAPDAVQRLIALMLDDLKHDTRSIIFTEGINMVISIIDSLVRKEDIRRQMKEKLQHLDYAVSSSNQFDMEVEANVHRTYSTLMERVPELVLFLKNPGPLEDIAMTWVSLTPPLGLARLKTVELLLVMLKTRKRYIEDLMIQLDMVNICLDLFFTYDMNNLLHILVDEIVNSCLLSDNPDLITCLFQGCHILERILNAVKEDLDGTSGRSKAMRKGYFGHITSISNKIHQAEDQRPLVQSFTQSCDAWREYVNSTLAHRNAIDSAALGGAQPCGIRSGDLLDGMDNAYFEHTTVRQFQDLEVPEEVEEMTMPVTVPHKYAPTAHGPGRADIWDSAIPEDQDEGGAQGSVGCRDAAFDARDAFLDDEKFEQPKLDEEVWQERQIVDFSDASANDVDWGRFDDPACPSAPLAEGSSCNSTKQNIVFFDVEEDSSSDDEPHFVPSPTKGAEVHGTGSSGVPQVTSPPITSPPVTSPPVTSPPVTSPPVTSPPLEAPAITPMPPTNSIVPKTTGDDCKVDEIADMVANLEPNLQGDAEEKMRYNDFNFWKPNWDDVSMTAQ